MRARVAALFFILAVALCASTGQQNLAIRQPRTRADIADAMDDLQNQLVSLNQHHESYRQGAEKLSDLYSNLNKKLDGLMRTVNAVGAGPGSDASSSAQLLAATKELREAQTSFNLQYLQLQEQMQSESRQYTVVSNIMKTKQDTVKNSINNIR